MVKWKCKDCGNRQNLEQLTLGYGVTNVAGVTLDDGLLCSGHTFVPKDKNGGHIYRCGVCKSPQPFNTPEEMVRFLTGRKQ